MSQIKQYDLDGVYHLGDAYMSELSGGEYVLHTDHLASHAFDEAKERAAFERVFPQISHSGSYDPWINRWKYTHEAVDSLWFGWLACAKARAKAAGCE